jgi:hypothetical protein
MDSELKVNFMFRASEVKVDFMCRGHEIVNSYHDL